MKIFFVLVSICLINLGLATQAPGLLGYINAFVAGSFFALSGFRLMELFPRKIEIDNV